MTSTSIREGFIPFRGYRTYYKVVGDLADASADRLPLLAIHGRPVSHEALEPLAKLAEKGRPVIFYDQIGCGQSDRPDDPSLWSVSLFVDELEAVRSELRLERIHLMGHSWGGMVAMEYALRQPRGVVSLSLSSTLADRAMYDADLVQLREALPADVLETLLKHEAAGTTSSPEYSQARRVYDLRHICQVDPWPDHLQRSLRRMPVARNVMPEGWSVLARLGEIDLPTLVTCGRHDTCTPAHAAAIQGGISGSERVVFEQSSHYPHIEESERYLTVIEEFMRRTEGRLQDRE